MSAARRKPAAGQPVDNVLQWPADKVERVPIAELIPYARNARQHTDAQVAKIAASIREWGWTIPVLRAEDGSLIAGHGRVLAARQLGIEDVPSMTAHGWSDAKIRAYRIADNKLAELSSWDLETLTLEFADLRDFEIDLTLTGFADIEIDQLFASDTDPLGEWRGMPEFEQNNAMAFHTIAVHFADSDAVQAFAELVGQPLTDKTRFIWYPQADIAHVKDQRYASSADELEDDAERDAP